ncbi:MAG TPA: beta-L-arabinofuranosidase domain-containing protein [Verrucomicrobiae bacterium]|nr:beta-L-arabinofuranosidase domain-containing protein [Verrucomicrobiae bacterium]
MHIVKKCLLGFAVLSVAAMARSDVKTTPSPQAEPFPLSQVRLLDSPFKQAMELDGKYLLSLEPDRLLSWYRKEAGLQPKAPVYGGWESTGLAGHTLGHYLSACSLMYQSTGDTRFLDRVDYIVGELAQCQQANGNGYLAAIPGGKDIFGKVARGEINTEGFGLNGGWSPWYTIHKELAGLIDANQLCTNAQALVVATNLANWVDATTANLTDAQWQKMLVCEYGGMNEALANLYGITGNPRYLQLAEKFYDHAVLDPLANGQDDLTGKHSNTNIPKIIGLARLYELTGDERYGNTAKFFWNRVALHRSFVIGGNGDNEHFFPVNNFARHLSPATAESCCTYNMLKLTRHLFEWSPDATEMDFYERALYNDILASQDPETGMFVYLMSLKPGHFKTFSTPTDSFWCCVGTGMENHSKYGDTIYFHDDQSLFLNLFIPSELSWPEKGLVVRQETQFPASNQTKLEFTCRRKVPLALKIRWPAWSDELSVQVNGRNQKISGTPGHYVTVNRKWRDGDSVEIRFQMKLRTEPLPGTTNIIAVLYGPIVLAGELGTNGMPDHFANNQTAYNQLPDPPAPVFVSDADTLLKHIRPTDDPLTFQTEELGKPNEVTLIPFYKMNDQRYSVYWTVVNPVDWLVNPAGAQARAAREMQVALEQRN